MTTKLDAVKKTLVAGAFVLSQTMLIAPMAALADDSVRIAGQPVFSVPSGAALSADTVQNNLDNALVASKDKSAAAVSIVYAKGMPVVTLGGYQVATIDSAAAQAAGTTPALLAKKWADSLRGSLADQSSVESYVAQLSGGAGGGTPPVAQAPMVSQQPMVAQQPVMGQQPMMGQPNEGGPGPGPNGYQQAQYNGYAQTPPPQGYAPYGGGAYGQQQPYGAPGFRQGRVSYAPAGLVIPLSLQTSISTQVAKAGDMIEAQISQPMQLGDGSSIPAGSTVAGTITDAEAGKRLSRSGSLQIKFTRLRTPDGIETPISGHLIGGIGKYTDKDGGDIRGEGWKAKLGQTAIRGGAGAGLGAALGTAVGAIAGRSGYGAGTGAWSGAAIGGGLGAGDMLLRKGRDVTIPSGTQMQLQLDAPATIAGAGASAYNGGGNL
jgi:hypothetical protein